MPAKKISNKPEKKRKILIIVGPTASGKSALAVSLARKFGGEIISADSRQVYRGLDIGSAKITKRGMRGIPHHLLDVASPKHIFTAHDFVVRARRAVEETSNRGKLPIVAGGTGFYVDSLTGKVSLPNVSANYRLRASLGKKTAKQLFALLKKRDPRRAKNVEPHNKRRIIRALEIADELGKNPAQHTADHYDALWIGLALPEKKLEKKITKRIFVRIRRGMVAEAEWLHSAAGGGLSYKRMEALGLEYRFLAHFLQKKISRKQMIEEMRRGGRLYAKRQMRYWKRNRNIKWFKPSQKREMFNLVSKWLR